MSIQTETSNDTIIDQLKQRKTYSTGTEVMELFCLSRNTLCRYVRDGRLLAVRVGKDNRFDPAVLSAWLEARQI